MVINIEDEMKKHMELSKTDLDSFRDWASKQPHFPEVQGICIVILKVFYNF